MTTVITRACSYLPVRLANQIIARRQCCHPDAQQDLDRAAVVQDVHDDTEDGDDETRSAAAITERRAWKSGTSPMKASQRPRTDSDVVGMAMRMTLVLARCFTAQATRCSVARATPQHPDHRSHSRNLPDETLAVSRTGPAARQTRYASRVDPPPGRVPLT